MLLPGSVGGNRLRHLAPGAAPVSRESSSDLAGQHDYASVGFLADRLSADAIVIAQREMDPATLESRHGLQLEHLPGLDDALRGAIGQISQLAFAPAPVVLDIDQDARPLADALRQQQIDEVLESGKPLALAPDQGSQGFLLVAFADHVQSVRFSGRDLDTDIEFELGHDLLEDFLGGGHGLGRDLGRLRAHRVRGTASGGDLGEFLGCQAGLGASSALMPRATIGPAATACRARAAVAIEVAAIRPGPPVAARARAPIDVGAVPVATSP